MIATIDRQRAATAPRRRRALPELVEQIATHQGLPDLADLPDDVAKELSEVRQGYAEWVDNYAATIDMPRKNVDGFLAAVLEDDDSDGAGWLFATADSVRMNLFVHIEEKCRLHNRAAQALSRCVEPLQERVASAEVSLAKSKEKAAKGLTAAGMGLETMRAAGVNPPAAETQFNCKVAECQPVKAAAATLSDASLQVENVKRLAREFARLRDDAFGVLREAAEGAVAI